MAVGVGQALRLDVPGPVQVPLDEALAPAERRGGLPYRRLVLLVDLLLAPGHLEAAAAAAERGLDRDRIAVPGPERPDLRGVAHRVLGPRGQRRPGLAGDVPGPHLVAERLDRLRRRADPGQARPGHGPGEVGVLREEPVAGVHRVRPGLQRHLDDLVDVQVGLPAGRPGQRIRLVRHLDVQRVQVGFGVHGDAGQAGVTARPDDTHRDLAAVRDQDLAQRRPPWFAYLTSTAQESRRGRSRATLTLCQHRPSCSTLAGDCSARAHSSTLRSRASR